VKSVSPLVCFHLNATIGLIPRFYNFKGERLQDDYIKLCQPKTYMAMQKKAWMSSFLLKKFLAFFNKLVLSGMSITNQHLLILDGHVNHVTLEAIEHAQEFGLDMITLPSHTSHVLQPLYVCCFQPFKTTLKKFRGATLSKSNHIEPNKIIMVKWVNQAIDQCFTNKNIKVGFQATCIWLFNFKAMDNKTQPSKIYNVTSINNHGNEEKYTSNEETIAIRVNNRAMNFLLQNFCI